jgi:hypothetical protein
MSQMLQNQIQAVRNRTVVDGELRVRLDAVHNQIINNPPYLGPPADMTGFQVVR